MLIYPTTMMEVFDPSVRIKNITFHICLIIKVYFTIKRTAIVSVLHHLIVLFTLRILRPYASHFQEFGFTLLCSQFWDTLLWHNQFPSQPLPVTLRERKPLQVSPKIIQSR